MSACGSSVDGRLSWISCAGLGLILVITACLPSGLLTEPVAQPPDAKPTQATPSPAPLPEHRIGIRQVNGIGEFYDRQTGLKFIPRGNNYIRLANQRTPSGDSVFYHSTFNVGLYDPMRTQAALERMHSDGYNVVRVFLNGCCLDSLGDPLGDVSPTYVQNLVDFLDKAKANDIYVMFTTDGPPAQGDIIHLLDTTWSKDFAGNSASFLRLGGLRAEKELWKDLIQELVAQGAPLDVIFAYQLRNELFFESNLPPLSLNSGIVTTANGKSYDMASAEEKQRMMDEGLVYWSDEVRAEILELDPTALVTVGFFWSQKPHPARIGDPRVIEPRAAIWDSSLDFIDLHPYPGWDLNMAQYVDNFGMAGMQLKPILMGEFGAARASYASEAAVAQVLQNWQVESCEYGFDGWLLWTWDGDEQTDFYNALTGQGLINKALAPINRTDACQPGSFDFFEHNLAFGKPTRASRSLPDQPPSGAVDGNANKWWGAGSFASQWIQVDLGEPSSIGSIRLSVTQSPPGDTLHEIWVGSATDQLYLVHTFDGYTVDGQLLEFISQPALEEIRYVRVLTRKSPSWVGWKEIEILTR